MYRAYFAIPRTLRTRLGEQVNAVFGVASIFLAILRQEEPDSLLVCFDAGDQTFRHIEHATYKEGRATTPDDFYAQIPRIMELVHAFGFHSVADAAYEADDLLCSYAKAATTEQYRVTIITGDRDALQLATEHVQIAIPHKGYQQAEYLGPSEIFAKYGIRPDQVPAYKGLVGDVSDNLAGVTGIGPKTASMLLQQFDTLERLYDHLDDVASSSVRTKLEAGRESAFFSQRMARLICDVPVHFSMEDLSLSVLPVSAIDAFFSQMEFTLLRRRLQSFCDSSYARSRSNGEALPPSIETLKSNQSVQQQLL